MRERELEGWRLDTSGVDDPFLMDTEYIYMRSYTTH